MFLVQYQLTNPLHTACNKLVLIDVHLGDLLWFSTVYEESCLRSVNILCIYVARLTKKTKGRADGRTYRNTTKLVLIRPVSNTQVTNDFFFKSGFRGDGEWGLGGPSGHPK